MVLKAFYAIFRLIRRMLLPVLILVVGTAGMVALVKSKPEVEPRQPEEKEWTVTAQPVAYTKVTPEIALFARVESPRTADLSASLSADVIEVKVFEGDFVSPDAPLIDLDRSEAELIVEQRTADVNELIFELEREALQYRNDQRASRREREILALVREDIKRARSLEERNLGSKSNLDQALREEQRQLLAIEQRTLAIEGYESRKKRLEATLSRARSGLARARLDLERTAVKAPFEGRITQVLVSPGDRVRPGDRLLTLFDTSALELRSQIPLRHLPQFNRATGQGVELDARATVDGRQIRARLHRLTAEVRRGSGGADALFRVVEGGDWLQLGRTLRLIADLPAVDRGIVLPRSALYGTDRVFVVDQGRMRGVRVERLGEVGLETRDSQILVSSPDLKAGDMVVVTQLPNAIDGLKLRVVDASGASLAIDSGEESSGEKPQGEGDDDRAGADPSTDPSTDPSKSDG
ncbi:efflux RND transporter periplasmic adaptor subunit [Thioalkalivibrio sp. HK1]|uniref:efflux RND transporter periplasmic adaptor subunit n=1 Tax=Thioalkalivibrio sp. HK1 TaxID=1469245 RepID=UPI000472D2C8|nr:efflux RND transporter periplasmic adaptor subunit [Thioalkalivibrio sp. HK1]